jgi:hypothetical protein
MSKWTLEVLLSNVCCFTHTSHLIVPATVTILKLLNLLQIVQHLHLTTAAQGNPARLACKTSNYSKVNGRKVLFKLMTSSLFQEPTLHWQNMRC